MLGGLSQVPLHGLALVGTLALVLVGTVILRPAPRSESPPGARSALAGLPVAFLANHGQFPAPARFAALGSGGVVAALPDGLLLTRHDAEGAGFAVRLTLGAEAGEPEGEAPQPGAPVSCADPTRPPGCETCLGLVRSATEMPGPG